MNFNVSDSRQRQVKCTKKAFGAYFPNAEKLKIGQIYNVAAVLKEAWKTWIFLKELPGLRFNSSHFEEMEDYKEAPKEAPITGASRKEILQNFLFTKKYESVMMYSARILPPKLVCAKVLVVNLPDYAEKLDAMREEDVFIIGRPGRNLPLTLDVEISEYGTIISCVQAYIVKEGDMYKIFDPSLNGCEIEF